MKTDPTTTDHGQGMQRVRQTIDGLRSILARRFPDASQCVYLGDRTALELSAIAEPVETDFTSALLMLSGLPLSNEERAEAVRRLLNSSEKMKVLR